RRQLLERLCLALTSRNARRFERERDVFRRGREQDLRVGVREEEADRGARGLLVARDVDARHLHVPRARGHDAAEGAREGRLSGSVRPDHRDPRLIEVGRDAIEDPRAVEVDAEVARADHAAATARVWRIRAGNAGGYARYSATAMRVVRTALMRSPGRNTADDRAASERARPVASATPGMPTAYVQP